MLAEYQEIAKQCSSSNATYEQYLQEMAAAEIQKRDSNATSRRINAAKIPTMKELSDFDFASIPFMNKANLPTTSAGSLKTAENGSLLDDGHIQPSFDSDLAEIPHESRVFGILYE